MTGRAHIWLALLAVAGVAVLLATGAPSVGELPSGPSAVEPDWAELDEDEEGFDPQKLPSQRPTVAAAFARQSYARGSIARLVLYGRAWSASVQLFRVGAEAEQTRGNDEMRGVPTTGIVYRGAMRAGLSIAIRIGAWESGLYFARIDAADGRVGFAPVIVRPRRLGENRVAVVLPTYTWQAYNFRDDDGDGWPDTWYAGWRTREARLNRPYLNRGVPPAFRRYDLAFLRWLAATGRSVDVLSDQDLGSIRSAGSLTRAYKLIVFPGHHEYVTEREYDLVTAFRNAGGNLIFLSANNFFWKVEVRGDVMRRVQLWRRLGRPEAALIGVQYRANDSGRRRGPWIVRDTAAAPWLFAGTGLRMGSELSSGGIEIDAVTPSSPRNVTVLAEIPNLYGPSYTAQMTYYRAESGARVFAAGAFSLVSSLGVAEVQRLLANLWAELSV